MTKIIFIYLLILLCFSDGLTINSIVKNIFKRQVNPCTYIQCQNGGTCITLNNLAKCICNNPFYGIKCQFQSSILLPPLTKTCGNLNCLNGGVCIKTGQNTAQCFCPVGFSGNNCGVQSSSNVVTCNPNNCLNDAPCLTIDGKDQCLCPAGFIEPKCEKEKSQTEVKECVVNPCQNNAECVPIGDKFTCLCPGVTTSPICE